MATRKDPVSPGPASRGPWAEGGSRFTVLFVLLVIDGLKEARGVA